MTDQPSNCVEREVCGVDVPRERERFEVTGKGRDERRARRPGFRNRTSRFVANRCVCAAARNVS